MRRRRLVAPVTLAISIVSLLCASPNGARENVSAIDWWSVDSGGAVASLGGDFILSGTIGQPDAGLTLVGGAFALDGGFQPGLAAAAPGCPGDLSLDGLVDGADLGLLIASWGDCAAPCVADLDHAGMVDGADLGVLLGTWGECSGRP